MKDVVRKELQGARAVVVGAGLAGLSAAVALAARGARVRVLEQAPAPGGRMRRFERGPYRFHLGEHAMTNPQVLGRLFVQADLRLSDFLEFAPLEPAARLMLPDGKTLDVFRDLDRLADQVARVAPRDADRLRRRWKPWERTARQFEEHFLSVPHFGSRDFARAATGGGAGAAVASASTVSLGRALREEFRSSAMAALFEYLAARHGTTIFRAPAGMLAPLALELMRGAWAPKGGFAALAAALVRVCEVLEIGIVCDARVERIELQDGRVRRVTGQGFKALRADLVVSTADPRVTVERLMARGEAAEKFAQRLESLPAGRSSLVVHLGCNRRWREIERAETVLVPEDLREAARQIDGWGVPAANALLRLVNEGATADDAAPEMHCAMRAIVHAPTAGERFRWNDSNTARERDRILARLGKLGLERFESSIAEEFVMTPEDWASRHDLPAGSLYGCWTKAWRGWPRRAPHACPGIGGLYFAGAGTHPGATAPLAILGGMLAAEAAAAR